MILLLSSVIIAAGSLIFNALSTRQMKRQVNQHIKQWEHNQVPIFRFSFMTSFDRDSYVFIIKNTNNKYHHIENLTFSNTEVILKTNFNGTYDKSGLSIVNKEDLKGLIVALKFRDLEEYKGEINIIGTDSLGNEFRARSLTLNFCKYKLVNHLNVTKTYLEKL